MPALLILLATTQLGFILPEAHEIITPRVAAERVSACGLGTVSVRSDADLDADILVVANADHVSEQQLACAEKAANYYDVELTPSLQPRFEALREARMAAVMVSRARNWLRKHDLLDRLPGYRPGLTDDAAFARKIETLCDAQGALESGHGPHVLNTQWAIQHMTPPDMKTGPIECLFNATAATGFDVGFIGNRPDTP